MRHVDGLKHYINVQKSFLEGKQITEKDENFIEFTHKYYSSIYISDITKEDLADIIEGITHFIETLEKNEVVDSMKGYVDGICFGCKIHLRILKDEYELDDSNREERNRKSCEKYGDISSLIINE